MNEEYWILIGFPIVIIGIFTYMYLSVTGKFQRFFNKFKKRK